MATETAPAMATAIARAMAAVMNAAAMAAAVEKAMATVTATTCADATKRLITQGEARDDQKIYRQERRQGYP